MGKITVYYDKIVSENMKKREKMSINETLILSKLYLKDYVGVKFVACYGEPMQQEGNANVNYYKCKKLNSLKQCLSATRPTSHN